MDFIRLKVSEGKELAEISEMICDHCLAPDTSIELGMGTDNTTVLIVAVLGGRTKEGWYSWITDRVKRNFGYETPTEPPQIYTQYRLAAFKERREKWEAREAQAAEAARAAKEEKEEQDRTTAAPATRDSDDSTLQLPLKTSTLVITQ